MILELQLYRLDFLFPKPKVMKRQTKAITGKEILDKKVNFQSLANHLPFPWLKAPFIIRKEERLKAEGKSGGSGFQIILSLIALIIW